jgi:hypothetical protein
LPSSASGTFVKKCGWDPDYSHYLQAKGILNVLRSCYVSAFHSRQCRLLGYKHPVRTSQETHYVSAIESSQLMLCKIRGFHGDGYEECRLLEFYAEPSVLTRATRSKIQKTAFFGFQDHFHCTGPTLLKCKRYFLLLPIANFVELSTNQEPQVVQPLRSFPAFYGTRRFITAFTRTLHQYLS